MVSEIEKKAMKVRPETKLSEEAVMEKTKEEIELSNPFLTSEEQRRFGERVYRDPLELDLSAIFLIWASQVLIRAYIEFFAGPDHCNSLFNCELI